MALTILGSTGSIGGSTLDVVARHSERFEVFALTANSNVSGMLEQCRQFRPRFAVMSDVASADRQACIACQQGSAGDVWRTVHARGPRQWCCAVAD